MRNEYFLYLPAEKDQTATCWRYQSLFGMIDREFQTVRTYIAGAEFSTSEAKHPLPYATLNGKMQTFEWLFEKIMVKSGKLEQ
jgi:hypothetical protein|tara:strand:+ start:53 stop:301 length:249 start_codon:yes stop_codon:yes gene_type:complete